MSTSMMHTIRFHRLSYFLLAVCVYVRCFNLMLPQKCLSSDLPLTTTAPDAGEEGAICYLLCFLHFAQIFWIALSHKSESCGQAAILFSFVLKFYFHILMPFCNSNGPFLARCYFRVSKPSIPFGLQKGIKSCILLMQLSKAKSNLILT